MNGKSDARGVLNKKASFLSEGVRSALWLLGRPPRPNRSSDSADALESYLLERVRMPKPEQCTACDDRWTVKCSKCQAQGYLLWNEGVSISSGDDIVICAQCKGTGVEPCPTCNSTSPPDG